MEIVIETNYLTQDEFDVATQLKVNAGVRQQIELLREAKKEKAKAEEIVSVVKRKYTKRKRKMPRISKEQIKDVWSLAMDGESAPEIATKLGLRKKTVKGLIYRLKNKPSNTMVKILGVRRLTKISQL